MIRTLLLSVALISAGNAADDFEKERKVIIKEMSAMIAAKQETMESHLKVDLIPAIARNYAGEPISIERLSLRYVDETYEHLKSIQCEWIQTMASRGKISERAFNEINDSPPPISINYSWEQGRLKYIGARPRFEDLDECGHSSK